MNLTKNEKVAFFIAKNNFTNREFGKKIKVSDSTVTRMRKGEYPITDKTLDRMLEAYDMTRAEFDDLGENEYIFRPKVTNVKVLELSAAANPTWSESQMLEVVTAEMLLPSLPSGHEYYAITIRGDSMHPTYSDRDMVVVEPLQGMEFEQDKVYLVLTKQGLVLKRLRIDRSTPKLDTVILSSDNSFYKDERVHLSHFIRIFKIHKRISDV
jgi:phage repressor protein C with HTH and peptisase S24 domain